MLYYFSGFMDRFYNNFISIIIKHKSRQKEFHTNIRLVLYNFTNVDDGYWRRNVLVTSCWGQFLLFWSSTSSFCHQNKVMWPRSEFCHRNLISGTQILLTSLAPHWVWVYTEFSVWRGRQRCGQHLSPTDYKFWPRLSHQHQDVSNNTVAGPWIQGHIIYGP